MNTKYRLGYLLLLNIIILFASCSDNIVDSTSAIDDKDNQNSVGTTFTNFQSNVLNKSCALSGCHVSGVISPDLSGNSYNRIVSKPSSTGLNYIEPNNPDKSYLLKKILGQNISGSRMPRGASPLSQSVIDSITTWISNGAKNN